MLHAVNYCPPAVPSPKLGCPSPLIGDRDPIRSGLFTMPRSHHNSEDTQVDDQQARHDGGEEGKDEPDQSPVGFWHPALKDTRRQIFKKWGITSMYTAELGKSEAKSGA